MPEVKYAFMDNPALVENADRYMVVAVDCGRVIESWRGSLFAHEWLLPDGALRGGQDLALPEQEKRARVLGKMAAGEALARPLLGIGLLENVEFCMGRAEFLTCVDMGARVIEVHIRKDQESDFKNYVCAVG